MRLTLSSHCVKSKGDHRSCCSAPDVLSSTAGALLCSGGCSTDLPSDSREEVAVVQSMAGGEEHPFHQLAAGGPSQAHSCVGGTARRKWCSCCSQSETKPSRADISKALISLAKILAVHQTCLEEVAVPDREEM